MARRSKLNEPAPLETHDLNTIDKVVVDENIDASSLPDPDVLEPWHWKEWLTDMAWETAPLEHEKSIDASHSSTTTSSPLDGGPMTYVPLPTPPGSTSRTSDRLANTPAPTISSSNDSVTRRQIQNRTAQRAHRERQRHQTAALHSRIEELQDQCQKLELANKKLEMTVRQFLKASMELLDSVQSLPSGERPRTCSHCAGPVR